MSFPGERPGEDSDEAPDMAGTDLYLYALLVGLLCGAANVLVDVDHIPSYLSRRAGHNRRFLHRCALLVGIYGLACAGGLLVLLVLTSRG